MRILFLMFMLMLAALPIAAQDTAPAQTLADPDGQFIDIDGTEIYYIARGEPTHPAVLLIHGFGGSTFTWRYAIDPLVEAGFYVVAFDRPPYGLADKVTDLPLTLDSYSELTASFMDALGIETAALVGHSAGGTVIARFVLDHPDRVSALVFVAGAVGTGSSGDTQADAQQSGGPGDMMALFSQIDPESPFARQLVRAVLTPERFAEIATSAYYDQDAVTPETVEGYARVLRVDDWEVGLLSLFSGGQPATVQPEALAEVAVPTLLMWGENDTWVPLATGETLAEIIPGAQLVTYPETGHLPMEEQPEAFNADLVAWLVSNVRTES